MSLRRLLELRQVCRAGVVLLIFFQSECWMRLQPMKTNESLTESWARVSSAGLDMIEGRAYHRALEEQAERSQWNAGHSRVHHWSSIGTSCGAQKGVKFAAHPALTGRTVRARPAGFRFGRCGRPHRSSGTYPIANPDSRFRLRIHTSTPQSRRRFPPGCGRFPHWLAE